jgi:glyoxylase-like metal-dependent hydrolase (beta-lactamase superfamily II)
LGGVSLCQVLVTHTHVDHASGAAAVRDRFPGVRFRKLPWPERDTRWQVDWEPIGDGDTVPAGDSELVTIHTPGHSPDHVCFWHEATRTMCCGDLAIKGTSVWIPATLGGNLADYIASLRRVLVLNPARMLPAHGPIIDEPVTVLREYIEHRLQRERQIVAALRAGDATLDAIVGRVYPALKESLVPLARESVMAHLLKLERDGRARSRADAWTMIDP